MLNSYSNSHLGSKIAVEAAGGPADARVLSMRDRFDSCDANYATPGWVQAEMKQFQTSASVLVVEDDDDTRDLLESLLKLNGYSVTSCPNAEEALEALREQPFDFVLTDYGLPNRTGGWLLKQATEEGLLHATPTLVVTAYSEPGDVNGAEILHKPFNPEGLLDLVRERTAAKASTASRSTRARRGDSGPGGNGRDDCSEPIELILYVGSIGPHSQPAINDIKQVLARYQAGKFRLTVRDLSARESDDGKVVMSAGMNRSGLPRTCILGHLAQKKMIVEFLDAC